MYHELLMYRVPCGGQWTCRRDMWHGTLRTKPAGMGPTCYYAAPERGPGGTRDVTQTQGEERVTR